jgi:ABC-type branched-subunit amino acid transport system ATPase component
MRAAPCLQRRLCKKTTISLVEQNANLALKVAHRGYVMENGKITLDDSSDRLLANKPICCVILSRKNGLFVEYFSSLRSFRRKNP